jgi:hypothetical protein
VKFEVYDWRANLGSGDPGWLHGSTQIPHPLGTTLTADWSDTNLPWAYANPNDWRSLLPAGVPVVNLSATGATFWDRLNNTVNAQSGRFICRLPAGDHQLSSFRLIGSSGDPTYSFGFWFPKLAGFDGEGADQTFVTMAANSMTTAQLNALSAMTAAAFSPNQMGLCRFDSSSSQPGFVGGVTFRAANQNPLTSVASDLTSIGVTVPQPAPHQGVIFYSGGKVTVSHVRFQGAGKAMNSSPPFEQANCASATSTITWRNCEFDGRLSSVFDSAQPRKCGPWMGNGEILSDIYDSWMHHSNVSRYAANDQNTSVTGRNYKLTRCKFEQITNTHNDAHGGYTNATACGWESTAATITVTDCIMVQNNSYTDGQIAAMFQLTTVGGVDPAGGRFVLIGGVFRNPGFPTIDGWTHFRIPNSHFRTDGYSTTIDVRSIAGGARKSAYAYSGSWPPSQAALTAAGVAPATHYLVRES